MWQFCHDLIAAGWFEGPFFAILWVKGGKEPHRQSEQLA